MVHPQDKTNTKHMPSPMVPPGAGMMSRPPPPIGVRPPPIMSLGHTGPPPLMVPPPQHHTGAPPQHHSGPPPPMHSVPPLLTGIPPPSQCFGIPPPLMGGGRPPLPFPGGPPMQHGPPPIQQQQQQFRVPPPNRLGNPVMGNLVQNMQQLPRNRAPPRSRWNPRSPMALAGGLAPGQPQQQPTPPGSPMGTTNFHQPNNMPGRQDSSQQNHILPNTTAGSGFQISSSTPGFVGQGLYQGPNQQHGSGVHEGMGCRDGGTSTPHGYSETAHGGEDYQRKPRDSSNSDQGGHIRGGDRGLGRDDSTHRSRRDDQSRGRSREYGSPRSRCFQYSSDDSRHRSESLDRRGNPAERREQNIARDCQVSPQNTEDRRGEAEWYLGKRGNDMNQDRDRRSSPRNRRPKSRSRGDSISSDRRSHRSGSERRGQTADRDVKSERQRLPSRSRSRSTRRSPDRGPVRGPDRGPDRDRGLHRDRGPERGRAEDSPRIGLRQGDGQTHQSPRLDRDGEPDKTTNPESKLTDVDQSEGRTDPASHDPDADKKDVDRSERRAGGGRCQQSPRPSKKSPDRRRGRRRGRDRRDSRGKSPGSHGAETDIKVEEDKTPDPLDEAPPSPPAWEDMSTESRYKVLSSLLDETMSGTKEEEPEEGPPVPAWIRCSPADLYFRRDRETNCMVATKKMEDLECRFENELINRASAIRATKPPYIKPERPNPALVKMHKVPHHHHHHHSDGSDQSSSSSSSSDDDDDDSSSSDIDNEVASGWMEELNRKQQHPERLHSELWFNEPGEMNDGPLCRCSLKSKEAGIRHDIYPGETPIERCSQQSNNQTKLYHYRITMSPYTNFLTKNPTVIQYDNHEYIFEGFSLLSHYKLENVPVCRVIRFNIEYTVHWFEEDVPENFSLRSLDLFNEYLFHEFLELLDLDWKAKPETGSCSRFHLMPRFSRDLPDNGKEVLSMNEVLLYLLRSAKPLIEESELPELLKYKKHEWQTWVDKVRGMIVSYPGMRPSSIRIDQLDREQQNGEALLYPMIIHFGIRPAQLSYAGDPIYQKLWKQYVKFKHLLANKPKITPEDKIKLERKEENLQDMRMKNTMKREVTVELSAKGFLKTGIKSDMCQHAMLLPVLIVHLRFHKCLDVLEKVIRYKFKDRLLLQLALTHPSYRVNFGTNPDHARNSLSNCGIRQPEYGDRRIHYVHTRKRGINTLINIMSRLGRKEETVSEINHYERLEFLGDAVVEFISSIHLYYMFPSLEEGGLATYRAAIVQNQHLAVLAQDLHLHDFMLYAHGPDLCHESDLRHAMANCLEALMGALFLDGGIDLSDRIFGEVLFNDDDDLLYTWQHIPVHPLQEDEPHGDRHWIPSSPALQKLLQFEDMTGTEFTHVRLLARAFTMRNVGYNNLTFGHNQRLEFLGDTVLQLVASEYLFKHFPDHHEGHLSLLRSSLVNNRTQAVVCDDLGMTKYIIHVDNKPYDQAGMKHKEKADLLEAFIGGLYVDKDLEYCKVFCHVCFFPRLKQFILNQDWNDPKSQLQQCCLTLRELDGGEPDIPIYKVIASTGPTNTRKYTVAVYFRRERLATGAGHSIQQAEMTAATNALTDRGELFPQLAHQKTFIERKYKRRKKRGKPADNEPRTQKIQNVMPEIPEKGRSEKGRPEKGKSEKGKVQKGKAQKERGRNRENAGREGKK